MSDGVHKLFDMEAKDEKLHDANETDDPVDSDVSTRVIVDDDAVEVRRSTMTLQVNDDLGNSFLSGRRMSSQVPVKELTPQT